MSSLKEYKFTVNKEDEVYTITSFHEISCLKYVAQGAAEMYIDDHPDDLPIAINQGLIIDFFDRKGGHLASFKINTEFSPIYKATKV